MSYFWTLSTNREDLVSCAIHPFAAQLNMPSGTNGGWGLGYYHVGEVLRRIEPHETGRILDVEDIVRDTEADLLIMHIREATVGPVRRENTHPFRFKDWLFAHNGTLTNFERYRDRIRGAIPPFVLRNLRGETDSEHLFHLVLSFLFDRGLLDRPDLGVTVIQEALLGAISMIDELSKKNGDAKTAISAAISDGYSLVVASRGIPVDYVVIEGLKKCNICRSSIQPSERKNEIGVDHNDLKAILIKSAMDSNPLGAGFTRLEDNSFLMVTKKHTIEFAKFS